MLLRDAGYWPCPFTGMGTGCCLVGAYVLAGELARRGRRSRGRGRMQMVVMTA